MAEIQNTDNTKCWQESGATGTLILCWWEHRMVQLLWEALWIAAVVRVRPLARKLPHAVGIAKHTHTHTPQSDTKNAQLIKDFKVYCLDCTHLIYVKIPS